MMNRLQRMNAVREALVLAVVLASLAAAAFWVMREPADKDELRLSVSTLRSQAAEFELLLAQAKNKLGERFVQNHATQLAKAVDSSREELDGLDVQPSLRATRDQAKPLAARLASAVHGLEAQPHASAASQDQRLASSLKSIEDSLEKR